MTTAEQLQADLRATKENLLTYGWYQGDAYGPEGCFGPRCLMMAVIAVTKQEDAAITAALSPNGRGFNVVDVISREIWKKCGDRGIAPWNDAPERTFEDVIDLLDGMIADLGRQIEADRPVEEPQLVEA